MNIELIKIPTGDIAMVVNGVAILSAEPRDDTARVELAAELLATATDCALVLVQLPTPAGDWTWEGVIEQREKALSGALTA